MNDVYTAPMRDIAPMGAPSAYTDAKKINALLRSTDPEKVAASGRSYQDFARKYGTIADDLLAMREDMLEAWNGQDAAAAQAQLREVWAAATTVQKTADRFGVTVERHGSESLWWYKNRMPTSTSLGDAQNWMTGANDRISASWNALPADISTTLPPPPRHSGYRPPAPDARLSAGGGSAGGGFTGGGGSAGGGLADGPAPGGPESLSGGGHRTHGSSVPGGDSGADLADFSSGPPPSLSGGLSAGGLGGGLSPGRASGLGTPGGVGVPGGPGMPGGGVSGVSGIDTGGAAGTSAGISRAAARNAATAAETDAAEAGAAASRSGIVGPMLGGGAGGNRQEHERRRENWIAEDDETWAGEDVAPPVIGEREPEPAPETPAGPDLRDDDDIADLLGELDDDQPPDPAAEIAALRAKLERLERRLGADTTADGQSTDGLGWMSGENA